MQRINVEGIFDNSVQKYFYITDTTIHEIEETFNTFTQRSDIAIILITQKVFIFMNLYL